MGTRLRPHPLRRRLPRAVQLEGPCQDCGEGSGAVDGGDDAGDRPRGGGGAEVNVTDRYNRARRQVSTQATAVLRDVRDRAMAEPFTIQRGGPFRIGRNEFAVSMSHYLDHPEWPPEESFQLVLSRRPKPGRRRESVPSWEDLVCVRACVWPDSARVLQVLPDSSDHYIALAESLHLWGPLP